MRKMWKKLVAYGLMGAMVLTGLPSGSVGLSVTAQAASTNDVVIVDNPLPFRELTPEELIEDMGIGWNLGNTMDGHNNYAVGETAWQNTVTTKEIIKTVHDLGFNTVRLPVTWGNMINEDYSIDEEWIGRVEDILDYCIAENMYVVMNIHHDGAYNGEDMEHGWLRVHGTDEEFATVLEKFEGVWTTIANRFKNYDEHLIFEGMNEVGDVNGSNDAASLAAGEMLRINELNQLFVNTVRATGGNNDKRWLSTPTRFTNIGTMIDEGSVFAVPEDQAGHIMVAAHIYDPISNNGYNYEYQFSKLKEKYIDNGVPVFIGEYGFTKNTKKAYQNEFVAWALKKYNLVGAIWDENYVEKGYAVVDREKCAPIDKTITDAIMRGFYHTTDLEAITDDVAITSLTSFDISTDALELTVGEKREVSVSNPVPEGSNDVVLWKSDNGAIASVSNGKIVARAIGETTVTAFSQSGTVEKKIVVKVTPATLEVPSTAVSVQKDAYKLEVKSELFLNPEVTPVDNQAYITYSSSNPAVASVSTIGKVRALAVGETIITATTNDGVSKSINIQVAEPDAPESAQIRLALNVLYNDSVNNYYGNEVSTDVVTANQDGTYTLKFDCSKDLSAAAAAANITTISEIGAIYIKDYDVTKGINKKSPEINTQIVYTSIKINDKELLSANTESFKTMKGGVFDTGNPFNAWDGSVVSEGIEHNSAKCTINFTGVENPTVLEVTFLLTGFPVVATPTPEATGSAQDVVATQPAIQGTATPPAIQPTQVAPTVVTVKKAGINYNVKDDGTAIVKNIAKKNAKSITVSDTVKTNGKNYKVVEIGKNAFKNNKKLKSVVIGKNVTKIGANAFNGCKNLKKITIKSAKLKSVGKNAIKGINKKAVIKVPKAKIKSYKKLFKKSTGFHKTMKIKKA